LKLLSWAVRPANVYDLLATMINSHAFHDTSSTFYIPDTADAEMLTAKEVLLDNRLIGFHAGRPNYVFIECAAMKYLKPGFTVSDPVSTFRTARDLPFAELSILEMMFLLHSLGWYEIILDGQRQSEAPPYKIGDEKVWYRTDKKGTYGTIKKLYLEALYRSEALFSGGLCQLYHFQLEGYYAALLILIGLARSKMSGLRPKQPDRYYKFIINAAKEGLDFNPEDECGAGRLLL
jgi:hypothetical protein